MYSPNRWKHWMMTVNKDDVSGSKIAPNHWKHWMTAFQQDVTCVRHLWGLLILYMYSIDYIHDLSTTAKYQPDVPDYVTNNNVAGVPGTRYQEKKKTERWEKKKRKKTEKKKENKHSGSRLGVRSVLCCVQLMDSRRTTRKTRRTKSQGEGRDKAGKNKSRPPRGGGFALNLYLPGVSRWSGVLSHHISRCIVISYIISWDMTKRDKSRYWISNPIFRDWHRDVVSRRNISRYRTRFFAQLAAPSLVHQKSKNKCLFRRRTSEAVIFIGKNICTLIWGYTAVGRLGCRASKE